MRFRWLAILLVGIACRVVCYSQHSRASAFAQTADVKPAHSLRVLVYTRNGPGYVHANIPASVEALKQVGASAGFAVDATDSPDAFSGENLKRYAVIVFSNSNNEIFTTDAQRQALKAFVEHGGGVVGIHSAIGSERNWPWFAQMMGGRFRWHPVEQDFRVEVAKPPFLMLGVEKSFTVHDECYFNSLLNPDIHPLLFADRTSLAGLEKAPEPVTDFPDPLPLAWWHTFDGGREFYLALGHEPSMYSEPWFQGILRQALLWAANAGSVQRG